MSETFAYDYKGIIDLKQIPDQTWELVCKLKPPKHPTRYLGGYIEYGKEFTPPKYLIRKKRIPEPISDPISNFKF